jgi:hypothetical protein
VRPVFNRGFLIFALMGATFGAGVCRAGQITYDLIPVNVQGVTVTGTITTDGATGVLSVGDILGWDIDLAHAGYADETLSSATETGDVIVQGSYLSATASEIIWNFAQGVGAQFVIQPSGPPTTQFNVYTNRFDVDFNGVEYANYQDGIEAIANDGTASAPEPSTLALTVIAAGLLMALRKLSSTLQQS